MLRKLLRTKKAADRLGLEPASLRILEAKGLLHPIRDWAGHRRFRQEEVDVAVRDILSELPKPHGQRQLLGTSDCVVERQPCAQLVAGLVHEGLGRVEHGLEVARHPVGEGEASPESAPVLDSGDVGGVLQSGDDSRKLKPAITVRFEKLSITIRQQMTVLLVADRELITIEFQIRDRQAGLVDNSALDCASRLKCDAQRLRRLACQVIQAHKVAGRLEEHQSPSL